MKNEDLEMIKRDYIDMKKISEGDYSEIEELKKIPEVKRYLKLISLKNSPDLMMHRDSSAIIGKIIDDYTHGEIEKTNHIWCFLREFYRKDVMRVPCYNEVDLEQKVAIYRDLENGNKFIAVGVDEKAQFESTHNVTYGNTQILDYEDRYYNAQYHFFSDCVNEDQDVALKRIRER